MKGIFRTNKIY